MVVPFLLFCFVLSVSSHRHPKPKSWCGSPHYLDTVPENKRLVSLCTTPNPCDDPDYRDLFNPVEGSTPVYSIRVRWTVFGVSTGTIKTRISDNMDLLNEAYAPAGIQFVMDGAILFPTQAYTGKTVLVDGDPDTDILMDVVKTEYFKDPDMVLNIAVFDDLRSSAEDKERSLYGIATFPTDDQALTSTGGLALNDFAISAIGSSLTHEVGHCLGLLHTFTGEASEEDKEPPEVCDICGDGAEESTDLKGDLCADTPPTNENYECTDPTKPDCNGDPYVDTDFRNFMGYADDECMFDGGAFTANQIARARCHVNTYLVSWLEDDTPCTDDSDCDDDSECTDDTCNSNGICIYSDACDGNGCTPGSCVEGECVFGTCDDEILPYFSECATASCVSGGCEIDYSDCDLPENSCCETTDTPYCSEGELVACVCTVDPDCCDNAWDDTCIDHMAVFCEYNCRTSWIERQDLSSFGKAVPLITGYYFGSSLGFSAPTFSCPHYLDSRHGIFFRAKGFWSQAVDVAFDWCDSKVSFELVVFEGSGTTSAKSECVAYSPLGEGVCSYVLTLDPGSDYTLLFTSDYHDAAYLVVDYERSLSEAAGTLPADFEKVAGVLATNLGRFNNIVAMTNGTLGYYGWDPVQDFELLTGKAVLSITFAADSSYTNAELLEFISDTAQNFSDQINSVCLFAGLDCGSFSVDAAIAAGKKRALGDHVTTQSGKRATRDVTVEITFVDTGVEDPEEPEGPGDDDDGSGNGFSVSVVISAIAALVALMA